MADNTTPSVADHFWGKTGLEDDGAYAGVVALEKRLMEGKTTISQFKALLLERAELEKAYGNSLIKMAESAAKAKTDSSGEMKQAWETIVQGLKKTGLGHVELGRQMSRGCTEKFKEFTSTHSAKRKEALKNLQTINSAREKAYGHVKSAKAAYDAKSKDFQEAEMFSQAKYADPKAAEKANVAKFKAQQSREKAEFAYKQALSDAEAVRVQFETQFEQLCKSVELLERERVDHLRRDFWAYANLGSIAAVNDDNTNEDVRAALERVDPTRELHHFILAAHTGNVRPLPLGFVPSGEKDKRHDESKVAQDSAKQVPPLPPPPEVKSRKPTTATVYVSAPAVEPYQPVPHDQQQQSEEPPKHYDTNTYVVIYPYEAQVEAELTLQVGDVVEILDREEDPWWLGEIGDRKGMVYKDHLEPKL